MKSVHIFAVVLLAFCGISAAAGNPSEQELLEAQMLALEVSGQLQPPEEPTQQILNDLAIIRAAFPDMADIKYWMPYASKEMLVGLTPEAVTKYKAGRYHGLDALNEQYGVVDIDAHLVDRISFIKLTFDEVYNMELLSDIYEQAHPEGLDYAQPNYSIGDGSTISAKPPEYIFTEKWGDCPAGCTEGRNWNFRVENGQATLLSVYGPRGQELYVPAQYDTVQSAIDAACDGDTVIVKPGRYYENIDLLGKAILVTASGGPTVTIIDGQDEKPVVNCVSGEGPETTLEGFTITSGLTEFGRGMYIEASQPTIINCIFTNNKADGNGGAIFNKDGNPAVVNCIFWQNTAENGGGVYNDNGEMIICNCTFSRNIAIKNGKGLCTANGGNTFVTNCIFWDMYDLSILSGAKTANTLNLPDAPDVPNPPNIPNTPIERSVIIITPRPPQPIIYTYPDSKVAVNYSYVQDGDFTDGEGNIDADPRMVNPRAGDFRLMPGSPCIDAGDDGAIPADEADLDNDGDTAEPIPTDICRKPRLWGNAVDMGAIEYHPNFTPTADAGQDQTIEATRKRTRIVLDGSGSTDEDSTEGTNDDIVNFEWFIRSEKPILLPGVEDEFDVPVPSVPGDPDYGILLGSGEVIERDLPIGVHTVTLRVTDKAGETSTDVVIITIQDTTPPVITLNGKETITIKNQRGFYREPGATAYDTHDGTVPVIIGGDRVQLAKSGKYVVTYDAIDSSGNAAVQVRRTVVVEDTKRPYFRLRVRPKILRPMNYEMVRVNPEWIVRDNIDPSPEVSLVNIVAVERGVVVGDMSDSDDIAVTVDGAIYLRAKRSNVKFKRVYILTYQAADDSGNVTTRRAKVFVSRRQIKQIQMPSFPAVLPVPQTPTGFVLTQTGGR
ncbi:MAG: DUF5011 domain-containing protein [Sedimentisphaerales bacterium]|nr:DUF5011 domain-containing protein [Sedimentisphaerales bacterium]